MALVRFDKDSITGSQATSVRRELAVAFTSWIETLRRCNQITRTTSVSVYEAMWEAFAAWCVLQDPIVTFANMTEVDLQRFLNERSEGNAGRLSDRHAWRLLTLIDRVQKHSALATGRPPSAAPALVFGASPTLRHANLVDRPSLDYLPADKAARLVHYLRGVRPDATGSRKLSGWQELRSLAAVGLHLGAGLTPGDVRALILTAPQSDGKLIRSVKVPADGNRAAREPPIARWAAELLARWLTERARVGLPVDAQPDSLGQPKGPYLFPAPGGRQWGKTAHFDAVRNVLQAAEIETGSGGTGGLRLRHTFAVRQLKHGKSVEDVARYLGINDVEEMNRYLAAVEADDDVI